MHARICVHKQGGLKKVKAKAPAVNVRLLIFSEAFALLRNGNGRRDVKEGRAPYVDPPIPTPSYPPSSLVS